MFNFLNGLGTLKNDIEGYLQGGENMASGVLSQYFPVKGQSYRPDAMPKPANVLPLLKKVNSNQTQTPQQQYQQPQQPQQEPVVPQPQDFQQGFQNFGQGVPAASASAEFSKAASALPPTVDPYLPAVIALMETGGGSKATALNNLFNISGVQNGQQGFVNYPDYATAILGGPNNGVQSKGFVGTLLDDPAYAKFLQTGNLNDFFSVYTPPGAQYGNPSMTDLTNRYNSIRGLFPPPTPSKGGGK